MKYALTSILSALILTTFAGASTANASFNPGRIMDDAVMSDYNSMSTADIQRFLESKVTCDTWGTKPSEFGGGTRAQFAASRGWQGPPYHCMTTYKENNVSAAQLIYEKSQKYRISPKVLIVLLQKEQGLITDEWPLQTQYKTATGYGCPDTAPCDSQYFGLANQLDWAAKMFRAILDNSPHWYTPYVLGNNYIQYNPNASCGGSNVYIQNRATQALYNYTPYQPNQATLNAGWGTAHCGAYGNRNFYLYFNSWFGSTLGGDPSISDNVTVSQSLKITPDGSNDINQKYTASFTLKNKSGSKIDLGWMLVSVRDSGNFNLDFPTRYVSVPPNGTYTYSATRSFEWTDNMYAYINGNLTQNIGWSTSLPRADANISKNIRFRVGGDVVLTNGGVKIEKSSPSELKATATFRNHTDKDRSIGWFLISARDPIGQNIDFPTQLITVPANGMATYSQSRSIDMSVLGDYRFFANLNDTSEGGYGWTTSYPMSNDLWTKRTSSWRNGPNVIQTKPLELTVSEHGEAQATVTFKNQGPSKEYLGWVIVSTRRVGDSANYDFPPQEASLNPGETKSLTFKQQIVKGGSYTSSLIFNRPTGWTSSYAPSATPEVTRSDSFSAPFPVSQAGEVAFSGSGTKKTASITLKNNSPNTIQLDWLIIQMRDVEKRNLDFPGINISLKPGETRTFQSSRDLKPGEYSLSLTTNHSRYGWGAAHDTGGVSYPSIVTIK